MLIPPDEPVGNDSRHFSLQKPVSDKLKVIGCCIFNGIFD